PAMSVSADATFPALPPVTRFESLLLGAGARLDRFVLDRYLRRQSFTPPAGTELRERLARAREFYADRRFVDDPSTFFARPAPLPRDAASSDSTWCAPTRRSRRPSTSCERCSATAGRRARDRSAPSG